MQYVTTYNPYGLIKKKNTMHAPRNIYFDDYIYVSRKLIGLGTCITNFRRLNDLSQKEFAEICTEYGKNTNVKFTVMEINRYENYKTVPTQKKFQVLLKTMHITEKDIA